LHFIYFGKKDKQRVQREEFAGGRSKEKKDEGVSMAVQGNPVGRLQEHAQAGAGNHPQYEVTSSMGESHCPMFVMQVRYLGQTAEGEGTNKKMAKAVAARQHSGGAAGVLHLQGSRSGRVQGPRH